MEMSQLVFLNAWTYGPWIGYFSLFEGYNGLFGGNFFNIAPNQTIQALLESLLNEQLWCRISSTSTLIWLSNASPKEY